MIYLNFFSRNYIKFMAYLLAFRHLYSYAYGAITPYQFRDTSEVVLVENDNF